MTFMRRSRPTLIIASLAIVSLALWAVIMAMAGAVVMMMGG